jgi:hypothetical protein
VLMKLAPLFAIAAASALQFCARQTSKAPVTCQAQLAAEHPTATWLTDSGLVADLTGDSIPELVVWGRDTGSVIVAIAECPTGQPGRTWTLRFPPPCGSFDIEAALEEPGFPLEARGCESEPQPDEGEDCPSVRDFATQLQTLSQTGARGIAVGSQDCDLFHIFWDAAHSRFDSWRA